MKPTGLARRALVAIVCGLLAQTIFAGPAQANLLAFASSPTGEGREKVVTVTGAGRVLLRLRSGAGGDPGSLAAAVVEALNLAALEGARPADVTVQASGREAQIRARGRVVLTVTEQAARAVGSDAVALARQWRDNIAAAFSSPYWAISIGEPLLVPVGESRALRWGGTIAGTPAVTVSPAGVITASADAARREVTVTALQHGDANVRLTLGPSTVEALAQARFWAASILARPRALLTGAGLDESTVEQAALNAALAAVTPRPGATVWVRDLVSSRGGWSATVEATGPEYIPLKRSIPIALEWSQPPQRPVGLTMVSNVPEKVTGPGTILREWLPGDEGVRLLWHHVNRGSQRLRLACRVLNPSETPAQVHLSWAMAGPGDDEMYVGHAATGQFWRQWRNGRGYVATIPAGSAWTFCSQEFGPGQIVSGLAQVQEISGQGLLIETRATDLGSPAQPMAPLPPVSGNGLALSGYSFAATRVVELEHLCGDAWTFYHIGKAPSYSEDGKALPGDYGVLQDLSIRVLNHGAEPARVELTVQASGGAARGLFLVEGEMVDVGLLRPTQEASLGKFTVPPNQMRKISIRTIPQAGSNYPVTLVVGRVR